MRVATALFGISLAGFCQPLLAQTLQSDSVQSSDSDTNSAFSDNSVKSTVLGQDEFQSEIVSLRNQLLRGVPHSLGSSRSDMEWISRTQDAIKDASMDITHAQILVAVDRNPRVQSMRLIAVNSSGEWQVIGGVRVSTGKPGRKEHFKTPVGVFLNTDAILGYRAEGTYNTNHVRGLGVKGMRVWDFGWQTTQDWKHPEKTSRIRLEMHATDPAVMELRIGRADSEGCVRVPSAMNVFLDQHGILDYDYERAAVHDRRFAALLRPDRNPTIMAGNALVVFDSSQQL